MITPGFHQVEIIVKNNIVSWVRDVSDPEADDGCETQSFSGRVASDRCSDDSVVVEGTRDFQDIDEDCCVLLCVTAEIEACGRKVPGTGTDHVKMLWNTKNAKHFSIRRRVHAKACERNGAHD